jgi:hypothetical protein
MSSRIPLQMMSGNTPDYIYEQYCNCCYCDNQSIWMENSYPIPDMNSNSTSVIQIDSKKKSNRRSKHIPHYLRPTHIVDRRNTRERLRVQDVNQAFHILQQLLPNSTANKEELNLTQNSSRVSKARTLRNAVDYIEALQQMLNENN